MFEVEDIGDVLARPRIYGTETGLRDVLRGAGAGEVIATVSRRMENAMHDDSRRPRSMRVSAAPRAGRALGVADNQGNRRSTRATSRRLAMAAVLPMSLAGLLFTQPASAFTEDTVLAIAKAFNDNLNNPDCGKMITGPSAVDSLAVQDSIVSIGLKVDCPVKPKGLECPGLREVFDQDPPGENARSTLQGGLDGRTALFKGFQEGRTSSADFKPGQVPFPSLSPLEARELILLHEVSHATGALGNDRPELGQAAIDRARAWNSALVRVCIRPGNPGFPTSKQFWLGPAAACGRPAYSTPACSAILGTACPKDGVFVCTGGTCDADDRHVFYQGYLLQCL